MADQAITNLTAGAAISAGDKFLTRQGAETQDKYVTGTQLKAFASTTANQKTADASGTVYSLTASDAAIDFGTTDPTVTLDAAGTYLIVWDAVINYNAATFAAVRDVTIKARRTNNTAVDLTGGSRVYKTDIITTLTYTMVQASGSVIYTTAATTDVIALFGQVSTIPSAGSLDVVSANIRAIRLQQ